MRRALRKIGPADETIPKEVDPEVKARAFEAIRPNGRSLCKLCVYRERLGFTAQGFISCGWSMEQTSTDEPITRCAYYECMI